MPKKSRSNRGGRRMNRRKSTKNMLKMMKGGRGWCTNNKYCRSSVTGNHDWNTLNVCTKCGCEKDPRG
jgi:hypothetical protein